MLKQPMSAAAAWLSDSTAQAVLKVRECGLACEGRLRFLVMVPWVCTEIAVGCGSHPHSDKSSQDEGNLHTAHALSDLADTAVSAYCHQLRRRCVTVKVIRETVMKMEPSLARVTSCVHKSADIQMRLKQAQPVSKPASSCSARGSP